MAVSHCHRLVLFDICTLAFDPCFFFFYPFVIFVQFSCLSAISSYFWFHFTLQSAHWSTSYFYSINPSLLPRSSFITRHLCWLISSHTSSLTWLCSFLVSFLSFFLSFVPFFLPCCVLMQNGMFYTSYVSTYLCLEGHVLTSFSEMSALCLPALLLFLLVFLSLSFFLVFPWRHLMTKDFHK